MHPTRCPPNDNNRVEHNDMTDFEDIRPYSDDEVEESVQRLLNDPEFIATICAFRFKQLPRWFRPLLTPLVRRRLKKEIGHISNVANLQTVICDYLDRVIESSTSQLTFSGLENLKPDEPYLFISNHRDIVMDPAFVNYALYHNGFDTLQIAIGDNLLQKPFVSDLMRLNKSFIVKRSANGIREKMAAYLSLSRYIEHSIGEGSSIWIAQREGRAKDGIDRTEPAIIKMLFMSHKKNDVKFSDYINKLKIIPIAISYEYNPCDCRIAQELYYRQESGSYQKKPGEDMDSIAAGITGNKGDVHISFGTQLQGEFKDADTVAREIDRQITQLYRLHSSNYLAAQITGLTNGLAQQISNTAKADFEKRVNGCDEKFRGLLLQAYANPLKCKREAGLN